MEAAMRTLQVTLPLADARFLKRISTNMGWHVLPVSVAPKVKMTENEFRQKLASSRASAAKGNVVAMQEGESGADFINRILCTRS